MLVTINESRYFARPIIFNANVGIILDFPITQVSDIVQELRRKSLSIEEELRGAKEKIKELTIQLGEKDLVISNKDNEILNLRKIGFKQETYSIENDNDDEDSIRKLALKVCRYNLPNFYFTRTYLYVYVFIIRDRLYNKGPCCRYVVKTIW